MEADNENPPQVNRLHVDGMHMTNIVEWSKKRKLQSDQLDLLRPKHKCWVGSSSSDHASMFDENPLLGSMHNHMVRGRTDAAVLDERSEPESAKDSNSFTEEYDTAMSVSEETKVEADCAKTYVYGRPSTSFVNWDDYNVKDGHFSLDVSTVKRVSSSEEDKLVGSKYNSSYPESDIQALKNPEEHLLEYGNCLDHIYSEYAKDISEQSIDKEFEDILYSNGVNPSTYVLSSGRWNVNEEAQSNPRPPTIDQEFEEYFSMLML